MFDLLPSVVLKHYSPLQISRCRTPLQILKLPLHLSLRGSAFARLPLYPPSRGSAFARLPHICLVQILLHSCGLANRRSTWVQSLLQDCRLAALQSILVPIIIARLRLRSTWVQSSSQNCRLAALRSILVPIIIARLCLRSTLSLRSSYNLPLSLWQVTLGQPAITQLAPDRFALCLSTSPSFPCTLSFVLSR